jgi:hypothetical protein
LVDFNIAAPPGRMKPGQAADFSAILGTDSFQTTTFASAAGFAHTRRRESSIRMRIDNLEVWGETPLQKHPLPGFDLHAG